MRSFLILFTVLFVLIMVAAPASAQVPPGLPPAHPPVAPATRPVDPEKAKDIRRFLELSGSAKASEQAVSQMIGQFRGAMPKVPAEFWDGIAKEISTDTIIESLVPVYDKYLSGEDLKSLIAFYESPVAKKLVSLQPQIAQDTRVAGQKWGSDLAKTIHDRLREKGYMK